jgi:cobalt-zinc-cadmium efflux system protein
MEGRCAKGFVRLCYNYFMQRTAQASLRLALAATFGFFLVELLGGLYTNSLSLLADAFHMLLDAMALFISFLAVQLAERPSTPVRTYGYKRAEILAAFFNAMLLMGLSIALILKAANRFSSPAPVREVPMLVIAVAGLGINLFNVWLLRRSQKVSLNVRSAYLHVLSDSLGSVVVIGAAVLIGVTGKSFYDAVGSLAISALILISSTQLFLKTLSILMEASPAHLSTEEIRASLAGLPGVSGVHDLHVWTLTSSYEILTAHLTLHDLARSQEILSQAQGMLREKFHILHPTLQIETEFRAECAQGNGDCA